MPILETFSKRQKAKAPEQADVYRYDTLPAAFREQVRHIWRGALGVYHLPKAYDFDPWISPANIYWEYIENAIAREVGVARLGKSPGLDPEERCVEHLRNGPTDQVLDLVELSFRVIDRDVRQERPHVAEKAGITQAPDDAIKELNHRFLGHGLGYRYEGGQVIRIDSDLLHTEVTRVALQLLADPMFRGPNEEFLSAHEHYRAGRHEEAIQGCLKAFESVMKVICDQSRWQYPSGATASVLIDVLFQERLIPEFLQSEFAGLRSVLESGVPTVRNKSAGHGQGSLPREVPSFLAGYVLHLTAANILLLVEASGSKRLRSS